MKIGVWGDSIVYGEGDTEALGWVGRLRKKIESEDTLAEVYNFGVCGDTSKELLERFALEAESIHPSTIVFAIGINDSKYPHGETVSKIPLDEFKANTQLLIEQAKTFTETIYIVSAAKVEDTVRPSGTRYMNEAIQLYNAVLKELSEKENLQFIDVFDVLNLSTDLADGLHPNAAGYEKLFKKIIPQIQ